MIISRVVQVIRSVPRILSSSESDNRSIYLSLSIFLVHFTRSTHLKVAALSCSIAPTKPLLLTDRLQHISNILHATSLHCILNSITQISDLPFVLSRIPSAGSVGWPCYRREDIQRSVASHTICASNDCRRATSKKDRICATI